LPRLRDPARFAHWALGFVDNDARHTLRSLRNHLLLWDLDVAALNLAALDPPPWSHGDLGRLLVLLSSHSATLGMPACQIAAFMLKCCDQEHVLPHVRATAKACHLSVSTAARGFATVLLHWRHVLVAARIAL
jgi:hypothetical protein